MEVRIANGMFWIGGEMFPVHTIASVVQRFAPSRKGTGMAEFLTYLLGGVLVSAVAGGAAGPSGVVLGAPLVAFGFWRYHQTSADPDMFCLQLTTWTNRKYFVWSADPGYIEWLVQEIAAATAQGPGASPVYHIENWVQGNVINQRGDGSDGPPANGAQEGPRA
ncbi:DUF6232 family protein [Streptomyces profundus]|uniref:DUF6232 family protein n=1 Tax=Streptomyces profundus TaxID=2867410 RepID=UPI001D1645E4|nr:DUF6232 family protein [Streptomyces sp. MA3_2.13]UED84858.1 DUF6232 family protein [Streptomyces sp. MA3_2.13]